MKNTNVSLNEWSKQFLPAQKKKAKKANDYYAVVEELVLLSKM